MNPTETQRLTRTYEQKLATLDALKKFCCTKHSPENCDFQNMSSQTTYTKNMAQKSKNIDMSLSSCKEIPLFFT
jgi:hypothetical protein